MILAMTIFAALASTGMFDAGRAGVNEGRWFALAVYAAVLVNVVGMILKGVL